MPVAFAGLIPFLAAIGGAVGLSGVAATVFGGAVLIGASIGIGLLAQTFFAPKQPKPSDGQTVIRQSAASRFFDVGRWKGSGVLAFGATESGRLHRVIAMGHGEIDAVEEHWIDDTVVEIDGSGDATTDKYIDGGEPRVHIEFRLGTDSPAVYDELRDAFPVGIWTDDHLGKGVPHAYVRIKQVKADKIAAMFPNFANTNYRWVCRGAKVPDPNNVAHDLDDPSTWEWSENLVQIILFYLIYADGLKLPTSWITNAITSWQTASDIADEDVDLKAGGTVKRYLGGNRIYLNERPADVMARLLQAGDAIIYPVPGPGLAIKVGAWETPTVTIDDDAIIAIADLGRGRNALVTANTIRAQYTSRLHDYKETDADPWVDAADVAARGEIATDLQFFAVPNHSQARRLMKLAAHRANPNWTMTVICNLRALVALGERFVTVTSDEYGIDEDFEIVSPPQFVVAEGSIVRGIQLELASLTEAAYEWDETTEEGTAPEVPEPIETDNTLPTPENFTAALGTAAVGGGTVQVAVLEWDEPEEDFFTVEVRGRATTASEWTPIAVAEDATSTTFGALEDDVTYEFEGRIVSVTGRVSDWVDSTPSTLTTTDGFLRLKDDAGSLILDDANRNIIFPAP